VRQAREAKISILQSKTKMKQHQIKRLEKQLVDRATVAAEIRAITTALQAETEKLATSSDLPKRRIGRAGRSLGAGREGADRALESAGKSPYPGAIGAATGGTAIYS
jgi:hypothetical protein